MCIYMYVCVCVCVFVCVLEIVLRTDVSEAQLFQTLCQSAANLMI